MNPESFLLSVFVGDEGVTSALLRNDTPLPLPGDSFRYKDRDGKAHHRKVLSRTFMIGRDNGAPVVGIDLHLEK